jgi:hypothetical protein
LISLFLVSFFASLVFPILYLYSFNYLLVSEIVPGDQKYIPKPKIGDRISVYGVWVKDTELPIPVIGGWHEIHPVRYARINGVGYGIMPYNGSFFDGVYEPKRLIVLDKNNPYRIANGTVMDVFRNPADGDFHVHILVDDKHRNLLKSDLVIFPYVEFLRLMSFVLPSSTIVAYVLVSTIKPKYTMLGVFISRKFKSHNNKP